METRSQARKIPPLRGVRQSRGLSLEALAEQAEVDFGFLSKVERGERHLSVPTLLRLARILKMEELTRYLEPWDDPDRRTRPKRSLPSAASR